MAISGLRTSADFLVDGQRVKNFREGVLKRYPNGGATLFALTALMKERSVDDPEFSWYERELESRVVTLVDDVANTSANTTLTVASGASVLKDGDVLHSPASGESFQVIQDPTSDTEVLVRRGFAGTATAAISVATQDPRLLVIGSAYEEGSLAPIGVQLDPEKKRNFTQIFRQTLEFTRTAIKTRLRTGDQVNEAKRDALEMVSMDIERAFIFGKASEATRNGKIVRTCDGIVSRILTDAPDNVIDADGYSGTSMEELEEYLELLFRFGSDEKIGFVGNEALLAIQQIVRKNSTMNISPIVKEYGMNVQRLTTPFGELVLKRHSLFNVHPSTASTVTNLYYGMSSWLLVVDPANLQYVYLKDSDLKYQADLQANGLDGVKSGYLGECSIEVHHAKTHGLIRRLVRGVADA